MDAAPRVRNSVFIAITGSGGAGALTAGNLLLEAAARAGWYGVSTRSVGPQIRGGEAAALVRLSRDPVEVPGDRCDLLVALDWLNIERFAAELALGPGTLVLSDPAAGEVPETVAASGARHLPLPIKALVAELKGARANMVALGAAAAAVGLPVEAVVELLPAALGGKGEQAVAAGAAAVRAGAAAVAAGEVVPAPAAGDITSRGERWILTGNEAAGLGALRAGVRFVAGYPITPATDLLEWLAPALAAIGGTLVQAEDELSSVNMLIGASYGGVPALTATSGPGLALMMESLGLAVASEVPLVVVDVMRGGPSTGIPTKSEQSDLNIAVYGLHGDAPHLVLAPSSVADCLLTTQWAVHLAERLQSPAVVLSDQYLGQARAVIDAPPEAGFTARRETAAGGASDPYRRYALTASGVSPMAVPGEAGCQYTADGLTHDERGTPSSQAEHHRAQLDKRRDKLQSFDYGAQWADLEGSEGEGELAVITWGSTTAAVREALAELRRDGLAVRLVALRLLAPLRAGHLARALAGVRRLLVVEQTHSAQFHRYLRAHLDLPGEVRTLHRPGPLLIRPGEVREQILAWR